MEIIDTHTHLFSDQFDEDRDQMMERALSAGVNQFFLPNIDASTIAAMNELVAAYPQNCFPMMGVHPSSIKADYEKELTIVEKELRTGKYIAVGEIGMDLFWDKTFQKEQETAFRQQIEWAKELKLPIVIHCREAFDEILSILDEVNDDSLSGILHCFTGSVEQAKHIIDYGNFKLGLGGVLTFKNSGLDKVVSQLNLKDLVLETDSPYIAPSPYRGKRNESAYVVKVAEKLADIFELSIEETAQQTTENALEIFKING